MENNTKPEQDEQLPKRFRFLRLLLKDSFLFTFYFIIFGLIASVIILFAMLLGRTAEEAILNDVVARVEMIERKNHQQAREASAAIFYQKVNYHDCESVVSLKILHIMDTANPTLTGEEKAIYLESIVVSARKYDVNPVLVGALIARESHFDSDAVSKAGAKGPMQVIPKWHPEKLKQRGIDADGLHDIKHNIDIGTQIIREYTDHHNGDYILGLLKYVGRDGYHWSYINDIINIMNKAHAMAEEKNLTQICGKF
jgi:hypothetical protein